MVVDGKQWKVLVCCFGSRGDVQPFAALARGLQDSNYNVLGMTNVNDGVSIFDSLNVSSQGVHFDMAKFLREDPNMKRALETGSALQFGINMSKQFADRFPNEFKKQWKVAKEFQPDVIISTTLIWFQASAIGQALRVPVIHADLGPFSFLPVSKHTQTEMHEPKWLHKLSSFLMVTGMTISLKDKNKDGEILLDTMREELKDTIPTTEHILGQSAGQHVREWMNPITPNLFAISDAVLPKEKFDDLPPVYTQQSTWTGNWFVSTTIQEELAQNGDKNFSASEDGDNLQMIQDFIDALNVKGEIPAYIGWGSMVAVSPKHMTRMAVQSLKQANLSGIICGGFAKLSRDLLSKVDDNELIDYADKHVLFLQSAPHDWLFPKCCAVVHHGGAGTMAASLRSGVPTIITPCVADQYDNSSLIEEAGCGVGFKKALKKTTPKDLSNALKKCTDNTTNETIQSNARKVAEAMKSEDGIKMAVQIIDEFMTTKVDSGEWKSDFDSRLEQRALDSWTFGKALSRLLFYKDPFVED